MSNYPIGLPLEAARELVMTTLKRVDVEKVRSINSWQRILAEDILAKENIPPFDKSPYDGYALRSEDVAGACDDHPVTLEIIEEIPAGSFPTQKIVAGTAAKILTGAPIPEGADVVVPYEKTEFTQETVTLKHAMHGGSNIIKCGEDIRMGDCCAERGLKISTALMAQIAGLGYAEVSVYRKLRAAIFCTGSELVGVGEALAPGKIRNTNDHMLLGYLLDEGIEPVPFESVADDVQLVAAQLKAAAAEADCIITTGGASVGDYDVMKEAIELAGGSILFWKLKMKPGSAVVCGVLDGKPVFCLSGNPGAAAVTLQLLTMPALRYMMGMHTCMPKKIQVRMLESFGKSSPNRRILRGRVIIKNGEAFFATSSKQANGNTSAMRAWQACLDIPAGTERIDEGMICFAYDLEHLV